MGSPKMVAIACTHGEQALNLCSSRGQRIKAVADRIGDPFHHRPRHGDMIGTVVKIEKTGADHRIIMRRTAPAQIG